MEFQLSGLALGCMRLSSEAIDDQQAIALVHTALDRGARLLDTANVYAPDDQSLGHNERLLSRALGCWPGDKSQVRVATKAGLTRPGGRWRPDGRAKSLRAACEASLENLDVACLDLLQLHTPDPRVPIERSVRALDRLRDQGLVSHIGLCNVRVEEIERASTVTRIDSVQVALSPIDTEALKNGVLSHCAAHGIALLLHSPLGGARRRKQIERDPTLRSLAAEHGVSTQQIALAWLVDLLESLEADSIPLVGATKLESLESSFHALDITLSEDQKRRLDQHLPAARAARRPQKRRPPGQAIDSNAEVVLIMGYPGAGKTTLAQEFEEMGYARLNRDERGGGLADLLPELDRLLEDGASGVVLDNTYATRSQRFDVIEIAWRHQVPTRLIWLDTSLEQAQVNAAIRMVRRYTRLLQPDEMKERSKSEPNDFAPQAQYRYRRELEEPRIEEGFSVVERRPFERTWSAGRGKALFFDFEGVLSTQAAGSDDFELLPGRREWLADYQAQGFQLIMLSFLPGLSEGSLTEERFEAFKTRLESQLGLDVKALFCPHPPGPPVCWCRKPHPGLGVLSVERYRLDPAQCILVCQGAADEGLARRMGFQALPASELD